jgi:hypothetical protein
MNALVRQGPVPGPHISILYTPPLNSIISKSTAEHRRYEDDTQLFKSFSATDFYHNIAYLEKTITSVQN